MTSNSVRALWLACALLMSSMVGVGGGVLSFVGGDNPAKAVIAGAAAFGGAMALLTAVLALLFPGRSR
ncbi:hypothetical protein [Mangrovihabitans endophyticus]|uniref:Uncharacterized protein n=1 Tax=Mangrovihabitans endophyticus TaxID=1751298 RepID=A0A8J3FR76_9ACTN|nr:hypothetical protein [Mangrovihabitans endophyticus]GGL15286.1 hypothetical protein GCM10012284_57410 [Mangrovihabitans endophyticus]